MFVCSWAQQEQAPTGVGHCKGTVKQLEEQLSCLKSSAQRLARWAAFPWPILPVLGMLTPECRHIYLGTWLEIITLLIACIMYDLIFICV